MKLVNQYIIPFTGLKEGFHEFSFVLDNTFFDEYPVLEIQDGKVKAHVQLEKKTNMLNLTIVLEGFVSVACDRCLEHFTLPVNYPAQLVIKFGSEASTENDEIWTLSHNDTELNLKQFLFECIGLSIPIQKVHPDEEDGSSNCNVDMIKLLDSHNSPDEKDEDTDPRWNKLKNLYNNNNT